MKVRAVGKFYFSSKFSKLESLVNVFFPPATSKMLFEKAIFIELLGFPYAERAYINSRREMNLLATKQGTEQQQSISMNYARLMAPLVISTRSRLDQFLNLFRICVFWSLQNPV